jgi:predicted DCC family thiol-disulfide oxidoreductase YuxK
MQTHEFMRNPIMRPIGWVLYDDSCGFCRRWIPFWGSTLRKRGFDISPLQADWVTQRLGVPPDDLLRDLRLLFSDGTQVRGADVYRYVMRRIWWAYPLYLLSVAPLLRRVFDWGYRTFANNRYRVSCACRLPAASLRRAGIGRRRSDTEAQERCTKGAAG